MGRKKKSNVAQNSLGDALRDRARISDTDITQIWEEQERARKQKQALKAEYKRTKERAKKIKQQFLDQEIDEDSVLKSGLLKMQEAVAGMHFKARSQRFLRVIPVAEAWKLLTSNAKLSISVFVVLVTLGAFIVPGRDNISTTTDTAATDQLGVSTSEINNVRREALPAVESTEFDLLFPVGKSESDTQVVQISPPNNDTVYSYNDTLNGATLQLSQQQLPQDFVDNVRERVQEVATSFQAKNVIEIDGNKIYHGFNDNNGGIQSLIFTKNELLIFIKSTKQLPDEQWASYITNLK